VERTTNMLILLFAYFLVGCLSINTNTIDEEDIYIQRIVYSKYDSLPYTGKLERREEGSIIMIMNFKDGFPLGPWRGYYNYPNEVEKHGEFADIQLISKKSRDLIGTDSIAIAFEKSRNNPSYYNLTIYILAQENSFISTNTPSNWELYNKIALQIIEDLHLSFKLDYFELEYVDAIYLPTKEYSVRFNITNEKIVNSWIVQDGKILE